jgi:hypothetical protein
MSGGEKTNRRMEVQHHLPKRVRRDVSERSARHRVGISRVESGVAQPFEPRDIGQIGRKLRRLELRQKIGKTRAVFEQSR